MARRKLRTSKGIQKSSQKNAQYALLSVYNKEGIVEFAKVLDSLGYTIISTGGTAKILTENSIPVIPIQDITGNPESFDGRMKTISFEIESGILYDRTNPTQVKEAKKLKIKPIDIVVCNLYPFEKTVQDPKITLDTAVEHIDVGGPTMVRSAAKNFKNVLVVVDPRDYEKVAGSLQKNAVTGIFRKELAAKAFAHLSFYDSQISFYLNKDFFREELTIPGRKMIDLRYGENPHQQAAIYVTPTIYSPFANLQKLWGRDLSLTNVTDINAGIESVRVFDAPAAVVVKHNNPCGIALGGTAYQALERAIKADAESAFGGVIVLNSRMDIKTAKVIGSFKHEKKANIDIVAVPGIDNDALSFLQNTRKSMGIYIFGRLHQPVSSTLQLRWIDGGFIVQTSDVVTEKNLSEWKSVTRIKPTKKQLDQMKLAWKFITRIKSNAIIVVDKNLPMTRGIGSGQTSRVRSTKIALEQAGDYAKDAILASDSFFPFDDSVKLAAKYKIGAIVQQGGSVNDQMSIDAADKAGIAMVFTNRRAFWH